MACPVRASSTPAFKPSSKYLHDRVYNFNLAEDHFFRTIIDEAQATFTTLIAQVGERSKIKTNALRIKLEQQQHVSGNMDTTTIELLSKLVSRLEEKPAEPLPTSIQATIESTAKQEDFLERLLPKESFSPTPCQKGLSNTDSDTLNNNGNSVEPDIEKQIINATANRPITVNFYIVRPAEIFANVLNRRLHAKANPEMRHGEHRRQT
jgi:hypothetical protein